MRKKPLHRAGWVIVLCGMAVCTSKMQVNAQNSGFVGVSGTQFTLHARPAYFAGTNSYYQMVHRRWGTSSPDEVLDKVAAQGLTIVRTWAFQDAVEGGACLQCAPARQLVGSEKPTDFIDPLTLVALDQTLAAADARSIRIILTLVNNWGDYGGMDRWTLWRFGATDHDKFYSDATIRGWFKDLIQLLVHRVNSVNGRVYRDDPTIFAWELSNEARAFPSGAAALDAWIGEMSAFFKSVDPNHLVTTGIEGLYGPAHAARNTDSWMSSEGQDFIANHQHASIDFATCHIWPYNWGWDPVGNAATAMAKAAQYFQQRITDCETTLHKPLLCEEFGIPRDNYGRGLGSGPTTIRDAFYQQVFFGICQTSAQNGGACGGATNWLILDDAYSPYDDGNGVFLPFDASTAGIIASAATFLSRLRRGDLDFDGDVDQSDFGGFQACLGTRAAPSPCRNADLDNNGTVDQLDAGIQSNCASGPNLPSNPNCTFPPGI